MRVGWPHALQEGMPTSGHRAVAPSREGRCKSSFHVGAFSLSLSRARALPRLEFTPEPLTVARRRRRTWLRHHHPPGERQRKQLRRLPSRLRRPWHNPPSGRVPQCRTCSKRRCPTTCALEHSHSEHRLPKMSIAACSRTNRLPNRFERISIAPRHWGCSRRPMLAVP